MTRQATLKEHAALLAKLEWTRLGPSYWLVEGYDVTHPRGWGNWDISHAGQRIQQASTLTAALRWIANQP